MKHRFCNPHIVPEAIRVAIIRVFGVTIGSDLGRTQHLDEVLATCASSVYMYMYALRVIRFHGLQPLGIYEVARTTTVASLMNASPAWWGFTLARDNTRIEYSLQ